MKSISYKEIGATVLVIVFAFLAMNPFGILMSTTFQMSMYGLLLATAAVFVGLVAKEKTLDEREEKHRATAGRIGYLCGLVVLIIGVAVQTFSHAMIDAWIIVALVAMIAGKVFARAVKDSSE